MKEAEHRQGVGVPTYSMEDIVFSRSRSAQGHPPMKKLVETPVLSLSSSHARNEMSSSSQQHLAAHPPSSISLENLDSASTSILQCSSTVLRPATFQKQVSPNMQDDLSHPLGTSPLMRAASSSSTPRRGQRRVYMSEELDVGDAAMDDFILASSTHTGRCYGGKASSASTAAVSPVSATVGEEKEVVDFVSLRRPGLQECVHCRGGLPYGANFCPHCGASTSAAPAIILSDDSNSFADSEHCSPKSSPTQIFSQQPFTLPRTVRQTTVYRRRVQVACRQRDGLLGQGSHGAVYKAMDVMSGQLLAIKELLVNPQDPSEICAIRSELRNLASLRHPNVIEYYGCSIVPTLSTAHRDSYGEDIISLIGENDSRPVLRVQILMERMECGTLEHLLRNFPDGLPESTVMAYAAQLLEGILYVHASGVTHRDIKPSNVLMASDGTIKISDFGCAVMAANALGDSENIVEGGHSRLAGTPAYMPPEALSCVGKDVDWLHYGQAQDVWALGCIVHHLLTGCVPWSHVMTTNPFALLLHIAEKREFPISDALSPIAADFMQCCLRVNPTERVREAPRLRQHPFVALDAD